MAYSDAKVVLQRVTNILQDAAGVRWTIGELVMWLNEGMMVMATLRPDVTARTVKVDLTGGEYYVLQDLLADTDLPVLRFMRLIRNVAPESKLGAIRLASMPAMDAILPNWRSVPVSVNVLNFLTDPEDALGFYVFPPAPVPNPTASPPVAPARVELMYCAVPVPIEQPVDSMVWQDVQGTLTTEATFDSALGDYVLYRAFSKDAEYGGNGQRATAHYGVFEQQLGYESQGNVATKKPQRAAA